MLDRESGDVKATNRLNRIHTMEGMEWNRPDGYIALHFHYRSHYVSL